MNTPPIFPKDFQLYKIKNPSLFIGYYSCQIGDYEIAVEPYLSFKFTAALYINKELQEPKILDLESKESIQEAINKLFLIINNK